MFRPPFLKLIVDIHIEWFARWSCLGKGIGYVAAKAYVVDCGGDGPCQSMDWLFDTGGLSFGKSDDFAMSGSSSAGPP
jgi:hypothetical protein